MGGSDWQVNIISSEVLLRGSELPGFSSRFVVSSSGPGSEAALSSPGMAALGEATGREDRGTSVISLWLVKVRVLPAEGGSSDCWASE